MAWLQRLHDMGVTNIEMEAPEFAAFCKRMNIPALLICVTLLNRMEGDQVCVTCVCVCACMCVCVCALGVSE